MKLHTVRAGFTVVEMIIVIVVIGLLVTVGVVAYTNVTNNAVDRTVSADLENMAGIQSHYSSLNAVGGKDYYSLAATDGSYPFVDSELAFTPTEGNVIDVVTSDDDYCIRGYNTRASTYKSLATAAYKGSTPGACFDLLASVAAGGTGGRGLEGWWPLNGNAYDKSINARTGIVNGATLTTGEDGRVNGAYNFSPTALQWIDTTYNYPLNQLTVSAWVKFAGNSYSGYGSIVSNTRDCCSTYNGFQIQVNRTSPYAVSSRIWAGGAGPASTVSYNGLAISAWKHVVMTYNGTTLAMYIDGQSVGTGSYTGTLGSSIYNVYIGRGGWSGTGYTFGGAIDDVRIYNYGLSAPQVLDLYKAGAQ